MIYRDTFQDEWSVFEFRNGECYHILRFNWYIYDSFETAGFYGSMCNQGNTAEAQSNAEYLRTHYKVGWVDVLPQGSNFLVVEARKRYSKVIGDRVGWIMVPAYSFLQREVCLQLC